MRNVKTREGFKYWDKICSLVSYGFLHSPDNKRILKTPGIGNWIDKHEAQTIVDEAQDEINELQAQLATVTKDAENGRVSGMDAIADLQQRLTAAEQRNAALETELRNILQSCELSKLRDARIDALLAKPTESGACVACDGTGVDLDGALNPDCGPADCLQCGGRRSTTESGASE